MKILQVILFFSPKFGGSVTVPYQLSKELSKRGHDVTILTTDFGFDSEYAKTIEESGVRVIPFRTIVNFGPFIYTPSIKPWLKENIRKFDIIHVHDFRSYQNNCVSYYARKNKIPYIIQAHGSVLPFFEKQNLKKLYDLVWGEKILKHASKCVAVSKIEREQYLKMDVPENKIGIITNGIDVSEYEKLPKRGKFREKFGIAPDEKVILFLGRLHKSKGLDFLISGFSNQFDQSKNVKLAIAGPDDGFLDTLREQVKKIKIDEKIIITGPLYKKAKIEAFVDADVLVYPGQIEIFGLVPFEAIMCGTPVIVVDDCGCGDIIKAADCGYLVKYGDVNELKEKMNFALEKPDYNNKLVENGKRFIEENLTWEQVTTSIEGSYRQVIRSSVQ
jgi:glycosyltransferase involved in cell wall biosynthesis